MPFITNVPVSKPTRYCVGTIEDVAFVEPRENHDGSRYAIMLQLEPLVDDQGNTTGFADRFFIPFLTTWFVEPDPMEWSDRERREYRRVVYHPQGTSILQTLLEPDQLEEVAEFFTHIEPDEVEFQVRSLAELLHKFLLGKTIGYVLTQRQQFDAATEQWIPGDYYRVSSIFDPTNQRKLRQIAREAERRNAIVMFDLEAYLDASQSAISGSA